MPVNTTRVVGEIRLPQDVVPERSVVHFKITGFDTDAVDNVVIAPRKPQTAQIQNDGTIDINLWPNDDGTRSTLYNVELEIYNGNSPYIVPLGQIEVPQTAGPHDLTDLLPVQPPADTPLEEYLAQLQAAISSTEAAAVRAETAAQSINALDVQDDGTSVATPVIRINARAGLTATQDGTDPNLVHLDATGGGGGLPQYFSTSAVRTAITDGTLADGARFFLYDEPMIVDRSLDNNPESWLYNTNGDANLGVRTLSNLPFNYSVFPGFKTQDNNFLFLHTSPDNVRFYRVNKYPMIRGGGDSNIGGRDSQLFWNENLGEWWMPVTSGVAVTDRDFAVFRSKDLITWGLSDGFLDANSAAGQVRGQSVTGGTIPVERQWSNKFYRFNGTLYIVTSLQVLPSVINPFGNSAPRLRPYIAEVIDEDAMTFGPVSPLQMGSNTDAKLNPDIILVDGVYYASIKNSPDRTVEVWSTTDLFGVWTLRTTIDIDTGNLDSLEGNTWAVHKYIDPNDPGNVLIKYRLHLANNRDENDELIGIPRFTESLTSPAGPFGPIEQLDFSYASRNGTITNTAMVNDPRAMRTLMAAEAAFGGEKRDDIDEAEQLSAGTHDLYPQQDFEYYILGEAGSTTVTIREHVADRFFLAVHNTNPNATITVVGDSLSRPFTVGGGNQELIEVRWSEQINRYIPVGRFGTGGGTSGITVQDEGTPLATAATTLNFTGAGVTASGTGATKTINIPGGGGGSANDFRTRAAANTALASASNGTLFTVNGIEAVVDSTATGNESVFHDISGGIGARLVGDTIDTRFFEVGTGQNSDDSANILAANTYANAVHTASSGALKFLVTGSLTFTSPVDLGQTQEGFEIDMGGAHIEIPAGWTGAATDYALTLRGRTATKKLPVINCNKRCEGVRFANNAGSTVIGGAVYRMNSIGFNLSGSNCTFINQFGYEYFSTDPEYNTDANFTADVIHINSNDFKVISANVGWAARPIYLGASAAEVELIAPHPFNGNPNADGVSVQPRSHPRCIVSDAGGAIYISEMYLDNGYIEDRTGQIRISGGREFILSNRVTMTEPYVRVLQSGSTETVVDNYEGSFGFYTGAWQNNASNLVSDIHSSAMSGTATGLQRVVNVRGRSTTILRSGGVDENIAKQGSASEVYTKIIRPGTGNTVTEQINNGQKFISSGPGGAENTLASTLNLYPQGTDGTGAGVSELGMSVSGGAGLAALTSSIAGILRMVVDDNTSNITTSRDAGQIGTVFDIGSSTQINPNNGSIQFVSLSAARTLDIVNLLNGDRLIVDIRNADTNALTITSSIGPIRWVGGSAPSSFDVRTLLGIARRGSDIFIGAVGF